VGSILLVDPTWKQKNFHHKESTSQRLETTSSFRYIQIQPSSFPVSSSWSAIWVRRLSPPKPRAKEEVPAKAGRRRISPLPSSIQHPASSFKHQALSIKHSS
jgi:hypothetical protein